MSVVPIDFQDGVNDSNLGVNESIFLNVLMNVPSHYWSPFHPNDCVFSRDKQQKV